MSLGEEAGGKGRPWAFVPDGELGFSGGAEKGLIWGLS